MSSTLGKGGRGHAITGLRLLTMNRGADGYGFHMYTNRERGGQYIKSVAHNSPADLAGMLPGDHIVGVDGEIVMSLSHHQVVDKVRAGSGMNKKILVIDIETEDELKSKGEAIDPDNAIIMIPRKISTVTPAREEVDFHDGRDEVAPLPKLTEETVPVIPEPTLHFSMEAAIPKGRRTRQMVKEKSWKESIDAYNKL